MEYLPMETLLINPDGQWLRRMDIKDGYALQLAIKSGYKVAVISGSESGPVVERLQQIRRYRYIYESKRQGLLV